MIPRYPRFHRPSFLTVAGDRTHNLGMFADSPLVSSSLVDAVELSSFAIFDVEITKALSNGDWRESLNALQIIYRSGFIGFLQIHQETVDTLDIGLLFPRVRDRLEMVRRQGRWTTENISKLNHGFLDTFEILHPLAETTLSNLETHAVLREYRNRFIGLYGQLAEPVVMTIKNYRVPF